MSKLYYICVTYPSENIYIELLVTFDGIDKNLVVLINPSIEMNKKWKNVTRFPQPGSSLISNSRNMTELQHPMHNENNIKAPIFNLSCQCVNILTPHQKKKRLHFCARSSFLKGKN